MCLRTSWSPTRTARSVVRSGGPNAACTLVRFSGSCVWVPECDLDKLRLYNGISRPLAVMSTENTKLIEMQAASVAAVPSKLPWQPLLNILLTCETLMNYHNHLPGKAKMCSWQDSLKCPKLTAR